MDFDQPPPTIDYQQIMDTLLAIQVEIADLTLNFNQLQSRVKDLEDGHPPYSSPNAPVHAPLPANSGWDDLHTQTADDGNRQLSDNLMDFTSSPSSPKLTLTDAYSPLPSFSTHSNPNLPLFMTASPLLLLHFQK
ncbi:hypothetical protein C1646_670003 [Rhizophagus diaphanus]|nr:hypothetical protein C1646_670003 [Rhizophagus diaphanus] [Rhizophagus sp. MUCL 43196]